MQQRSRAPRRGGRRSSSVWTRLMRIAPVIPEAGPRPTRCAHPLPAALAWSRNSTTPVDARVRRSQPLPIPDETTILNSATCWSVSDQRAPRGARSASTIVDSTIISRRHRRRTGSVLHQTRKGRVVLRDEAPQRHGRPQPEHDGGERLRRDRGASPAARGVGRRRLPGSGEAPGARGVGGELRRQLLPGGAEAQAERRKASVRAKAEIRFST